MQNYSYLAEFEHGSASGEVQAKDPQEASAKVKAMYQNNPYDTFDANGKPIVAKVEVTAVTVKPVKE